MSDAKQNISDVLARAQRARSPSAADAERVRRAIGAAVAAGGSGAVDATGARAASPVAGWPSRLLLAGAIAGVSAGVGYWVGHRAGLREATPRRPAVSSAPARDTAGEIKRPAVAAVESGTTPLAPLPPVPSHREAARTGRYGAETQAPSPTESLVIEVRALRNAERALRDGNPGLALAFLQELDSAGPERSAGRRARRHRHDRPLRPRRPPLRRQPAGRVRPAPSRERLPCPGRTGLRGNGFSADRRLIVSEVTMIMKKAGFRTLAALVCGAGFSAACSGGGGTVNIGNTNAVGSQLSDYAASWDGYAEAYTFTPDGSDRVRLTIAASGQGTLEVGNQALVAAPTDPNLGYPPGNEDTTDTSTPPLWEGLLYPVYGAQVQTDRIQVGIKPNDYYAAWCALQTPSGFRSETILDGGALGGTVETWVPVDGGAGAVDAASETIMYFACPFPVGGAVSNPGSTDAMCFGGIGLADIPVDCGKYALCNAMVCGCTATGCDSSPLVAAGSAPPQYPVELDAALDSTGKTLTGTLALSTDLRVTVVLQKQ